ncbi:S-4TM family putative pore-forming effector [Bradyrhizobium sp. LA6.1]|uniref:S-4TM family putative pore-forming effector n=1 Tax=Bradyrhizobium sp. LA6.1 TaxID=3156378 RepID=UPI0033967B5D
MDQRICSTLTLTFPGIISAFQHRSWPGLSTKASRNSSAILRSLGFRKRPSRQRDATEGLDRVRSEAEALWNRAKLGACSETECTAQSRQFQSLIYERRSLSPLIFSWIYKIKRPRLEDQMNKGAEDFVRDIPSQAGDDASA